jgi:hypothetical protein
MVGIREFEAGFEGGVEILLGVFPRYIEPGMAKLNGIFREQHSLSAKKLRTMFGVKV